MGFVLYIILIFIFSGIVFILSASEIAVTMASRFRLHQMSKAGEKRASDLLEIQKHTHTLISAIVFVNTCLFAGITTIFNNMMSSFLNQWQMVLASFAMGSVITFYLEVLPKVYAYQRPESVGLSLINFIFFIRTITRPVTHFMDGLAHKTLGFLGVRTEKSVNTAREDLRGAIDLHTGTGTAAYERAMLRSVLDLSNISVEEVMVHRKNIVSFNIQRPVKELCEKILNASHTRIPLWQETPDNVIGVVNVKDLAVALEKGDPIDFYKLIKTPWFIPNTSTLFSQLQLFKEKRRHQAFVVDEYGSLMGMITLEDILEEIVGEIIDEHDIQLPGVRMDSQGNYIIQGSVSLRDLHRQYDWNFDENCDATTLAGLILNETRTIPDIGSVLIINGFEMTVLRRHYHQITLIRVRPLIKDENKIKT